MIKIAENSGGWVGKGKNVRIVVEHDSSHLQLIKLAPGRLGPDSTPFRYSYCPEKVKTIRARAHNVLLQPKSHRRDTLAHLEHLQLEHQDL